MYQVYFKLFSFNLGSSCLSAGSYFHHLMHGRPGAGFFPMGTHNLLRLKIKEYLYQKMFDIAF